MSTERPKNVPTTARFLDDDGGTWEDGASVDGAKSGLWCWWNKDGVRQSEADYEDGVLTQIRRYYANGDLYERSDVVRGKLEHRTWFIDPSQPFASLIGVQIMLNLQSLPTSVRTIKKLPGYPISYDCFNSKAMPLDKHGFPREEEVKREFQAAAKKVRSKRSLASKEAASVRLDEFLSFMAEWDFVIAAESVDVVRQSIEHTPAEELGGVVADFARETMKALKQRKWG